MGLLPGAGPVESVVAAENAVAAGTSFAATSWRAPGDPGNGVWFARDRDPNLVPPQDSLAFRQHFSDAAVEARWNALPMEARRAAEPYRERLMSGARRFARGRVSAIDGLGEGLAGVPLFAAHSLCAGDRAAFACCLLRHEAGHVRLAAWYGERDAYDRGSRDWGSELASRLLLAQPVPVSLYPLFTPGEYFAEHYAAWRTSPKSVTADMAALLEHVSHGEPLPASTGR